MEALIYAGLFLAIVLMPILAYVGYWIGKSDGYVAGYHDGYWAAAGREEQDTIPEDVAEPERA